MKKEYFILTFIIFIGSIYSVSAQDLIILKDGNVIEAKVTEISPIEIRYRRFNNLDGPVIVIARADVLSIRYENNTVEIFNPASVTGQGRNQTGFQQVPQPENPAYQQSGEPTLLQQVLNRMPAVPIAGNNLKFEFHGETWTARVNGENFSTGAVELEETAGGAILTLRQTHFWPGAVGRTAGRFANIIPGGSAVSGALNMAGNIAGAAGAIEMPGPVIVLEYKAGPPASLVLLSSSQNNTGNARAAGNQTEKSAKNWLSLELNMVGGGARYERMLSNYISLGGNVYWQLFGVATSNLGIDLTTCLYPFKKIFYLGVGFGFHGYQYREPHFEDNGYREDRGYTFGYAVFPEIGLKLDVGKKNRFYMDIGYKNPCIFGGYYGFTFNTVPHIGFGWAF